MNRVLEQLHTSSHCHHATEDTLEQRIQAVALTCQQRSLRFTSLRQQVLELILRAERPIGAYEILSQLQQQQSSTAEPTTKLKALAPPTVYRSLDFLLANGFIHQLSSANAYIPCCHPQGKHMAVFLICQQCGKVEEVSGNSMHGVLSPLLAQSKFMMESSVMEISGICFTCQSLH